MARLSLRVGGPPFVVVEDDDDDVDRPGYAFDAAVYGGTANCISSCGTGIGLLVMKHGSICSFASMVLAEAEDEDVDKTGVSICSSAILILREDSNEAEDEDVGEVVHGNKQVQYEVVNKPEFVSTVVARSWCSARLLEAYGSSSLGSWSPSVCYSVAS